MARHYIEFRIWLAPTVDTGLATAVANEVKDQLDDFVRDAPVTVVAVAYAINARGTVAGARAPVDFWQNHHPLTEQWFPPGLVVRAMRRREVATPGGRGRQGGP